MFLLMTIILLFSSSSALAVPQPPIVLKGSVSYKGMELDRNSTDYTITIKIENYRCSKFIGKIDLIVVFYI